MKHIVKQHSVYTLATKMPSVSRSSGSVNGRNKGVLQQELWQFIWLHQDPQKKQILRQREREVKKRQLKFETKSALLSDDSGIHPTNQLRLCSRCVGTTSIS